ncbi:MAG: TetR/AcrR family transcriptional regulator [Alphaproteobacteria bacterium]|nr:TetR/AcrR family transcriptional regulator [Alphaproteobacteria bacterium]
MRIRLVGAARGLFATKGYAETSTPEIVQAAAVTRGALYHHYPDKAALFLAVVRAEAAEVAAEIERSSDSAGSPPDALLSGAEAYFTAMKKPGRTRILLLDGPAVLGAGEMARIDGETGGGTLAEGLRAVGMDAALIAPTAEMLSAGFDRAALAIAEGADAAPYLAALERIVQGLVAE